MMFLHWYHKCNYSEFIICLWNSLFLHLFFFIFFILIVFYFKIYKLVWHVTFSVSHIISYQYLSQNELQTYVNKNGNRINVIYCLFLLVHCKNVNEESEQIKALYKYVQENNASVLNTSLYQELSLWWFVCVILLSLSLSLFLTHTLLGLP